MRVDPFVNTKFAVVLGQLNDATGPDQQTPGMVDNQAGARVEPNAIVLGSGSRRAQDGCSRVRSRWQGRPGPGGAIRDVGFSARPGQSSVNSPERPNRQGISFLNGSLAAGGALLIARQVRATTPISCLLNIGRVPDRVAGHTEDRRDAESRWCAARFMSLKVARRTRPVLEEDSDAERESKAEFGAVLRSSWGRIGLRWFFGCPSGCFGG